MKDKKITSTKVALVEGRKISSQTENGPIQRKNVKMRCEEYLNYLNSDANLLKVENAIPLTSGLLGSTLGTTPDGTFVVHRRYLFQGRVPIPAIKKLPIHSNISTEPSLSLNLNKSTSKDSEKPTLM